MKTSRAPLSAKERRGVRYMSFVDLVCVIITGVIILEPSGVPWLTSKFLQDSSLEVQPSDLNRIILDEPSVSLALHPTQ